MLTVRVARLLLACITLAGCAGPNLPTSTAQPSVVPSTSASAPEAAEPGEIAFHSDSGGRDDFYAVKPDGTGLRQITVGEETVAFPYWSPDGSKIAYLCCARGETSIWVMDADGTEAHKVADAPAGEPAWSPDGERLAYASYADESIWTVDSDGTDATPTGQQGGGPEWSPDGMRLVFFSRRDFPNQDQRNEIYVANADGSDARRLTDDAVEDVLPVWSPDGMRIAWVRSVDGMPHIVVMDADGIVPLQLTNGPDLDDAPAWSPDGSRILFVRYLDGADPFTLGQGNAEIFTVAADGGAATNLTRNPEWDGYPAWSPDGSRIAFSVNDGAQFNLMVMDADGSHRRQLPGPGDPGVANDCCPAWRPAH
jgi:TolB protein